MFFSSRHAEDKRIFSVLLLITLLIIGVIGYALYQLQHVEPLPKSTNSLEETNKSLGTQLHTISDDTLSGSLDSIEKFLITEELKAKIDAQVSADTAVTSSPQE